MKLKIALLAAAAVVGMVLVAPVSAEHPDGDPIAGIDAYVKGCRKGDTVTFDVDSADGGARATVATATVKKGAVEVSLTIPAGYTSTDVLLATCSKGSLAASLGGSANFCGADPDLGIYADIASQGNRFCLKTKNPS